MKIAIARKKTSRKWRTVDMTWEQFLEKLNAPLRTGETAREYRAMSKDDRDLAKEAAGGFVGGALNGGQRKTEAVRNRWLLTLDADHATADGWEKATALLENRMAVYSTHSHTSEAPRLRWVIPVSRAMTPDEYPAVARKVASWLDIETMDPTTYEVARLMYWPTASSDGEYVFRHQDGPVLDPDKVLRTYGADEAWKDSSLWPIAKGEQEIRLASMRKAGDPTEKPGLVGLFCRTYDVPAAIDAFLGDVYAECAQPGRYTYTKGSTAGGAVLYGDGQFLYSNHATDPCGGQCCNAFDLVRIHLFGAQDDEVQEGTSVTKLPSYKAMCAFAAGDAAVKRQMAEERAEAVMEDFADLTGESGEDEDEHWTDKLVLNSKTGECEPTQRNAFLILTNDPELKGAFGTDLFSGGPKLKRDVLWRRRWGGYRSEGADQAAWTDTDDAELRGYMQERWKFRSDKDLMCALDQVMSLNAFHPVRDYLNALAWDGVPRLEAMLHDYLGVEDNVYTRAVSRKWMAAAVARVMKPGCKFDCMLVATGPQGLGKSTFARILSRGWFTDSDIDMKSKSGYEAIQGKWIVELPELASVQRADIESVKSFVAAQSDSYRPAYGRRMIEQPRQCVFFGNTNDLEFLRDRTGARRFWPVKVSKQLDWEALERNADQLWAEAVVRFREGEYLDIPERTPEKELWQQAVALTTVHDELADELADYLDTPLPENWYELSPETRRDIIQRDTVADESTFTMRRDMVCVTEIRVEMLGESRPGKGADQTSRRLANLMNNMPGWEKCDRKARVPGYFITSIYRRRET